MSEKDGRESGPGREGEGTGQGERGDRAGPCSWHASVDSLSSGTVCPGVRGRGKEKGGLWFCGSHAVAGDPGGRCQVVPVSSDSQRQGGHHLCGWSMRENGGCWIREGLGGTRTKAEFLPGHPEVGDPGLDILASAIRGTMQGRRGWAWRGEVSKLCPPREASAWEPRTVLQR